MASPLVWVLVRLVVLCLWACPVPVLSRSHCIHRFSAGDVVMIQPQNCPEDVQQFCQLLRLDPDRRFVLKPTEPGRSCPLLLSLPAGTGQPPELWPSLELCFSFAVHLVNRELGVADGYMTSACLAMWGLSFLPSAMRMWIPH